jgi:hypothetical protein
LEQVLSSLFETIEVQTVVAENQLHVVGPIFKLTAKIAYGEFRTSHFSLGARKNGVRQAAPWCGSQLRRARSA